MNSTPLRPPYTLDDLLKYPVGIAPAPAPTKKVYFLIKYGSGSFRQYSRVNGKDITAATRNYATRFDTASSAITAIADFAKTSCITQWSKDFWHIISVEETPAPAPVVKLISTTVIDATKPVVLFNSSRKEYGKKSLMGCLESAVSLQTAAVFNDVNDALTFVQAAAIVTHTPAKSLQLHQVSVVLGTPTITETVLS